MSAPAVAAGPVASRLSFLDRYLAVWILVAMAHAASASADSSRGSGTRWRR